MLKKYKAIFFDWDGTAVMSRRAPVDQAVAAMRPLLQKGIKLIIVSGTTIENIAGGKIESYFAEVMFFMDYDAPDLVKNAKEIMLHDILTWERYIDSAMRYVVNFFPAFAVFPALPFLQERKI